MGAGPIQNVVSVYTRSEFWGLQGWTRFLDVGQSWNVEGKLPFLLKI